MPLGIPSAALLRDTFLRAVKQALGKCEETHPAHYQVLAKRIRHAVEKRRDEEEVIRLATFPRLNPNPVVEVDLTGKIHYMNPAARARYANAAGPRRLPCRCPIHPPA